MELKPYQKKVISGLETYLEYVQEYKRSDLAFNEYWNDRIGAYNSSTREGMEPYKNNVPGAPNVCIKVPTAGGKTFIACNALKTIFDAFDYEKTKSVIWLVPSRTILDQTIKNLSNISHPYRQKINTHFGSKVEVYTKEKLLQGAGFNPTVVNEQLSIIILSFDTLRSRKKEDRKIYQENGQLASFGQLETDKSHILKDIDETALINVIRKLNPIVIVDESHNAETDLSIEMLKNLNPCFVLDLTATPRNNSNIISFVNAFELKKENMVKLPVIVYNHKDKTEVVNSALQLQKKLELLAIKEEKEGGKYIRPIVLFQAQPRVGEDSTTFEKLKQKLIDLQIPEDQIKIKTADNNELKNIELLSRDCPVRYIITVNALKEGWDCPFAYILASLADKTSSVDVEQILGRVLRQPYVKNHSEALLNLSYVLTASNKFMDTLENIVQGLNRAGFSSKDYIVPDNLMSGFPEKTSASFEQLDLRDIDIDYSVSSIDFDKEKISFDPAETANIDNDPILQDIENTAIEENTKYEEKAMQSKNNRSNSSFFEQTELNIKPTHAKEHFLDTITSISIPQFYLKVESLGLFGEEDNVLLSKETLLKDFKLSQCDTSINFTDITSDLYKVDLESNADEDYTPTFMKLDRSKSTALLEYILTAPKDSQIREITARLMSLIGTMWPIPDVEIKKYINRIIEDFSTEQITDFLNREYTYKDRIKEKIRQLAKEHSEDIFSQYLDIDKISIKNNYQIPEIQYPGDVHEYGIVKSLYSKEFKMNNFERRVINDIANLENIKFWTRNPERGKGFYINGFINHYPDFIVVTKSQKIIIIETKGDDRDNTDSSNKIKLGRAWANKAGQEFKYFMIFDKNQMDGAYTLADSLKLIKEL